MFPQHPEKQEGREMLPPVHLAVGQTIWWCFLSLVSFFLCAFSPEFKYNHIDSPELMIILLVSELNGGVNVCMYVCKCVQNIKLPFKKKQKHEGMMMFNVCMYKYFFFIRF